MTEDGRMDVRSTIRLSAASRSRKSHSTQMKKADRVGRNLVGDTTERGAGRGRLGDAHHELGDYRAVAKDKPLWCSDTAKTRPKKCDLPDDKSSIPSQRLNVDELGWCILAITIRLSLRHRLEVTDHLPASGLVQPRWLACSGT
jgi:hypothetical protein